MNFVIVAFSATQTDEGCEQLKRLASEGLQLVIVADEDAAKTAELVNRMVKDRLEEEPKDFEI